MADGGDDDVCGVAVAAFEMAAAEVASIFMCPITSNETLTLARSLRKTTTDLRIGTTEYRNGEVVQKSPFARFLAPFDFRLFDSIGQEETLVPWS